MSFALGGNGSGKTAASAKKCADFLLNQKPPRRSTPFWVIAKSYYQVCAVCWEEKLWGQQFLPSCEVEESGITWYEPKRKWPLSVPLKPWPDGTNWVIEFKSYEQGRESMQARSIGGFWFSEQFPWNLFVETLRGCRDTMYAGGQFAEFTPIDPELCIAIEGRQDNPPPGWGFYRLNTELNRPNLAADWYESFFAAVPDEMLATRKTGALATFEGVIYQAFNPAIHVTDDDSMAWLPGTTHHRGFDFGASVEHPMAAVWGCTDGMGDWLIYDEYWDTSQEKITQDHAAEILSRSIAWGWPEPPWFEKPAWRLRAYRDIVRERSKELRGRSGRRLQEGQERSYGDSYGDPARPGEIAAFNNFGIPTFGAANAVYAGINTVRALLKVNPIRQRPRLRIHRRCKHAIEELRKYRWNQRRQTGLVVMAAPAPTPLKKDDDTADAARYLLHTVECRKGLRPATAHTQIDEVERPEVQFARMGNGEKWRPAQAGQQGWWSR